MDLETVNMRNLFHLGLAEIGKNVSYSMNPLMGRRGRFVDVLLGEVVGLWSEIAKPARLPVAEVKALSMRQNH